VRLIRKLLRLYRNTTPYFALLLSPFARPAPRLLWRSKDTLRKPCVYVHFDRRGRVHDYVLHQLREIRGCGFDILFVSNRLTLDDETDKKLREQCAGVMVRRNRGHDFGAWKDGIAVLGDPRGFEALLLANDSVYGPIYPLADVLQRLRFDEADVWGITDNWDIRYHLQSYFLLFSPTALRSDAFRRFWGRLRYVPSKTWVVHKYEVGLTTAMMRAGLRCAALAPVRSVTTAVLDKVQAGLLKREDIEPIHKEFLARTTKHILAGKPLNATHQFWDYLVAELGCPFIKRDLLQRNPTGVPYVQFWEKLIRQVSNYDTRLIENHLKATLRDRSV
jgi:lipopolysaccharide biosynthesis protein